MNKGFTLVELLAAIIIIAVISSMGIYAISNLTNSTNQKYYESLASTLELKASDYFKNNKNKRPGLNEICSMVSSKELIDNNYIKEVIDENGNSCDLLKTLVYIKRNDNKEYEYKVILSCNDHKDIFNEDSFCQSETLVSSTIIMNSSYDVTKSYINTPWTKDDVTVNFTSSVPISKYIIINTLNNNTYVCNAIDNECSYTFSEKGNYRVISYDNDKEISNNSFNIRIDKQSPTFELKNTGNVDMQDATSINYTNSIANISDESGIAKINYTLKKNEKEIINKITSDTNIFVNGLSTGFYKIKIIAYDYANNSSEPYEKSFNIVRNIKLLNLKNNDINSNFKVVDGYRYDYLHESLPTLTSTGVVFKGWYTATSGGIKITDGETVLTTTKALYARWE